MNWTIFFDIVFALGALAGAGFLAYGGWLCRLIRKPESPVEPVNRKAGDPAPIVGRPVELSSSVAMPLLVAVIALGGGGINLFLS